MKFSIILCFLVLLAGCGLTRGMPQPNGENSEGRGGRGAGIFKKLMFFDPDFTFTMAPTLDPNVPKKRRSRGEKWMDKFHIRIDFTTSTTTTKPTTTTKSPEELVAEKRKKQELADPKNFMKKLIQLTQLGETDVIEKANGKTSVDKEVIKMDKKLHGMLEGCHDNKDCGNSTCCYKEDPSKRGKCIMTPHRLDQKCSDLCGCRGEVDGVELVCKVMELTALKDDSAITDNRKCKQRKLTEQEYTLKVLQKIKGGKRAPKTLRTQRRQRVMFT